MLRFGMHPLLRRIEQPQDVPRHQLRMGVTEFISRGGGKRLVIRAPDRCDDSRERARGGRVVGANAGAQPGNRAINSVLTDVQKRDLHVGTVCPLIEWKRTSLKLM